MLEEAWHWVCVWGSKVRGGGAFHNQAGEELLVRIHSQSWKQMVQEAELLRTEPW